MTHVRLESIESQDNMALRVGEVLEAIGVLQWEAELGNPRAFFALPYASTSGHLATMAIAAPPTRRGSPPEQRAAMRSAAWCRPDVQRRRGERHRGTPR
jgi:hypothetical protein